MPGAIRLQCASLAIALLALSVWAQAIAAEESAQWHADLPVFLTATMQHRNAHGEHDWQNIASILAELRLKRSTHSWSIGPVLEVHRTISSRDDTAVASGLIFRDYHDRWDTTALVYRNRPRHSLSSWNYGARLRYRVSHVGKLGAETYGVFGQARQSSLWLGYYGDLTTVFSFRLLAGTNIDRSDVQMLRMDLVLQVN